MRRLRALPIVAVTALVVASCGANSPTPQPSRSAAPPAPSANREPLTPPPPSPAATAAVAPAGLPALADILFPRGDALSSAMNPGPGPVGRPETAWSTSVSTSTFFPILVGGLLVIGAEDGPVMALDARTGAERWQFALASGTNGTSIGSDGHRVVVSDGTAVYGLDAATGADVWTAHVEGVGGRGVIVDGVAYAGTPGGAVGLDMADGSERWRWTGGAPGSAVTTIHVVDGTAYVSSDDGWIRAIDMASNTELPGWGFQAVTPIGNPNVAGDTVYFGTTQQDGPPSGRLYAVDRASGHVRWQFVGPSGRQLIPGPVRDGIVYVSGSDDGIYALRDDGSVATQVWHVDAPRAWFPMVLVGDILYEQRADGSIGAYATADGSLLWETPAITEARGPLVSGGMVFTSNNRGVFAYADGTLVAQLAKSSPEPTRTPAPTPLAIAILSTTIKQFSRADLGLPPQTSSTGVLGTGVGPDGLLYVLDTQPKVTVIDPETGKVVRSWGEQGSSDGQFDVRRDDGNPGYGDIEVGSDGLVYVGDGSNHRIQVFKPDGTFVRKFGSFGTGPGRLGTFENIELGPDGTVYVFSNGGITTFTREGKARWQIQDPIAELIIGMTVTHDGSILVSCEMCRHFIALDPADGRVARLVDVSGYVDGDGLRDCSGDLPQDAAGHIVLSCSLPGASRSTQAVIDEKGTLIGLLTPATPSDVRGVTAFLGKGRAVVLNDDGLAVVRIAMPSD
jgi:outer membrane protein assembly factor BamB